MRPCAGHHNHDSQKIASKQVIPDLGFIPFRNLARRTILRLGLPVQQPCVIEIFTRDLPLQPLEYTVLRYQILLKFLLPEVENRQVDFAVEFLGAAISISPAEPRDGASTRVTVHSEQTARTRKRSHRGINKDTVG